MFIHELFILQSTGMINTILWIWDHGTETFDFLGPQETKYKLKYQIRFLSTSVY